MSTLDVGIVAGTGGFVLGLLVAGIIVRVATRSIYERFSK